MSKIKLFTIVMIVFTIVACYETYHEIVAQGIVLPIEAGLLMSCTNIIVVGAFVLNYYLWKDERNPQPPE